MKLVKFSSINYQKNVIKNIIKEVVYMPYLPEDFKQLKETIDRLQSC